MVHEIEICTLNRLYRILDESDTAGVAAVISTSWDSPDPALLRGIPFICRRYRDIDLDEPGAFSDEDAGAIAAFVRGIGADSRIRKLYVCCDAAVSRSPAVFAAIARYWNLDFWDYVFQTPEFTPNMFVFRRLSQVLGAHLSDEDCDALMHMSRKALRNSIRRRQR